MIMRVLSSFSTEMVITYLLFLLFTYSSSMSIGSTSVKRNVAKRQANGDLFPDWVPFKNKHGAELGEFVDVTKKKPKKRLALPTNFVLKSQGDQEVEEYNDKGPEEATGDDYFDKKEWSATGVSDSGDVNKSEKDKSDPEKIVDIDGIVNLITKQEVNPVQPEEKINFESVEDNNNESKKENGELKEVEDGKEEKHDIASDSKLANKDTKKDEGDYDYEEKDKTSKEKSEQSEDEVKKAKILDSVDELKERHAEEQRQISEKIKEEELFKDEQERNFERFPRREYNKYDSKEPEWRKGSSEYDEYDEKLLDVRDKYKIVAKKSVITTPKPVVEHPIQNTKLSLFSNPNAFLINDYEESEERQTTSKPKRNKNTKDENPQKFSSRYLAAEPKSKGRVRISLVPEEKDSKEGEPTLFFPKKRLGKRRFKEETMTSETTQAVPPTTPHLTTTSPYFTTLDTETTGVDTETTAADSVPSAADTDPSASVVSESTNTVTDPVSSATDKKEQKQTENYEFEKGGGKEHKLSHEEEHGEHGKKAYEGKHEDTKTKKGFHDKENHVDNYDDHGGVDKDHHDESQHYGHHHHEEHGKKHAKYEESGKHSKGHSTKGSHDIHKKDEYEKRVEFFEEEGDSDEEEQHGGHHDEKSHGKGGHFKKQNLESGHKGHTKGDTGHFSKGGFGHYNKGHKLAGGYDGYGRQTKENYQHGSKDAGKKWIYHHGVPPRTPQLGPIDRADARRFSPRLYR